MGNKYDITKAYKKMILNSTYGKYNTLFTCSCGAEYVFFEKCSCVIRKENRESNIDKILNKNN